MCNSESLKGEEGGRNKKHEETIPRNIIIKLLKIKDKEKNLESSQWKRQIIYKEQNSIFLIGNKIE